MHSHAHTCYAHGFLGNPLSPEEKAACLRVRGFHDTQHCPIPTSDMVGTQSYTSFLTIIPSSFPLSWSGSVWACSLDSHQHYVAVWLKQELYRYCLCTCPLMCFYQFTRLLSLTASEIKNTKVSVQSLNTTTATPAGNPVHCTLTWWHVTDCSQVLKSLNNM